MAVSFLHGFRNPAHERRVAEILAEEAPEVTVSLSSEVSPGSGNTSAPRRRSATSTSVRWSNGIAEARRTAASSRDKGSLYIMLSNGGTASVQTASRYPIRLLESGPRRAPCAAYYGRESGFPEVLSFDMGGTTAKACVVEDGEPLTSKVRNRPGLPVQEGIGLAGEDVGNRDDRDRRRRRPSPTSTLSACSKSDESAGADPGPVCYGRGGDKPTVTDADLILGYLDPDFFLGGRMELDREGASRAIEQKIASQLGIDAIEAAWGIHQVVNENMANAARVHAVERGKDPRKHPLFLSAGPARFTHTGSPSPSASRVCCAARRGRHLGLRFLCAPLAFDFKRSLYGRLDDLDWSEVNRALEVMEMEEEICCAPLGSRTKRSRCDGSARCDTSARGTKWPWSCQKVLWARTTPPRSRSATDRSTDGSTGGRPRCAAGDHDLAPRGRLSAAADPARTAQRQSSCALRSAQGQERDISARARGLPERTGLRSLPPGSRRAFEGPAVVEEGIYRCSWSRCRSRDRRGPEPDREVVGVAQETSIRSCSRSSGTAWSRSSRSRPAP